MSVSIAAAQVRADTAITLSLMTLRPNTTDLCGFVCDCMSCLWISERCHAFVEHGQRRFNINAVEHQSVLAFSRWFQTKTKINSKLNPLTQTQTSHWAEASFHDDTALAGYCTHPYEELSGGKEREACLKREHECRLTENRTFINSERRKKSHISFVLGLIILKIRVLTSLQSPFCDFVAESAQTRPIVSRHFDLIVSPDDKVLQ